MYILCCNLTNFSVKHNKYAKKLVFKTKIITNKFLGEIYGAR